MSSNFRPSAMEPENLSDKTKSPYFKPQNKNLNHLHFWHPETVLSIPFKPGIWVFKTWFCIYNWLGSDICLTYWGFWWSEQGIPISGMAGLDDGSQGCSDLRNIGANIMPYKSHVTTERTSADVSTLVGQHSRCIWPRWGRGSSKWWGGRWMQVLNSKAIRSIAMVWRVRHNCQESTQANNLGFTQILST